MRAGAALALALLEAEIVDADDARRGDDPTAFVQRSLARLWLPEGLGAFDYGYALEVRDDRLVFAVRVERGLGIDFTPAAACDALHPRLGPSLLTHLRLHTPLTPAFTPEVCRDYLAMFYWEGSDDAENLYYLARNDLAYDRGIDEALVDEAEVRAFADSHYFTPGRVDALLERRYTDPGGGLPLGRCLELCREGGLADLTRAAELLCALRALAGLLPACDAQLCADPDGYEPFAAVVALPRPGDDLVDEVYAEYEESVWQGGAFNPVYALAVDPADPVSLAAFGRALAVAQKSLELTGDLYRALEATCPRP